MEGTFTTHTAFRYLSPTVPEAMDEAKDSDRIIAFSQYPQWSCSTSNSSFVQVAKYLEQNEGIRGKVSIIDRWYNHPSYIKALAEILYKDLSEQFEDTSKPLILFTAHSIPLEFVNRGDTYSYEVAASAQLVMKYLKDKYNVENPYRVVWQSRVGPKKWIQPSLTHSIEQLHKFGWKQLIVSPLGFTSDHIETSHELDIEMMEDAEKAGGYEKIVRAKSLNDNPLFIEALADIVQEHLESDKHNSRQVELRCVDCVNEECGMIAKLRQ